MSFSLAFGTHRGTGGTSSLSLGTVTSIMTGPLTDNAF